MDKLHEASDAAQWPAEPSDAIDPGPAEPIGVTGRGKSGIWPPLPANVVKSTGRTLQILEFFDDTRREASVVSISKCLGYPQSSTSTLMRSLVQLGYLQYDPAKRTYFPTNRVRILGSWINTPLFGDCQPLALVDELNHRTGHTVFLAARNGLFSQYIHTVQATTTLRLHLTPGTLRPIATSASGKALLSKLSDPEVEKLVRRINVERAPDTEPVDARRLVEELAEIRKIGCAVARDSLVTPGAAVIAILLPASLAQPDLVLGIGGAREAILPRLDENIACMSEVVRRFAG